MADKNQADKNQADKNQADKNQADKNQAEIEDKTKSRGTRKSRDRRKSTDFVESRGRRKSHDVTGMRDKRKSMEWAESRDRRKSMEWVESRDRRKSQNFVAMRDRKKSIEWVEPRDRVISRDRRMSRARRSEVAIEMSKHRKRSMDVRFSPDVNDKGGPSKHSTSNNVINRGTAALTSATTSSNTHDDLHPDLQLPPESSVDKEKSESSVLEEELDYKMEELMLPPLGSISCLCDRFYNVIAIVTSIYSYAHAILYIAMGIASSMNEVPGRFLAHQFFHDYKENFQLSPFVPIWYNINNFPFNTMFLYISSYSWMMVILYTAIIVLIIITSYLPFEKGLDYRKFLIALCVLICLLKSMTIIFPGWYTKMCFDANDQFLYRMIRLHYRVLGTDSITTVLNVLMLMGKCCGVHGIADFNAWGPYNITVVPDYNPYKEVHYKYIDKLPDWPKNKMTILFKIPASCCPQRRVHKKTEKKGDEKDKERVKKEKEGGAMDKKREKEIKEEKEEEEDQEAYWTSLRECVGLEGVNTHNDQGCDEIFKSYLKKHLFPYLVAHDIIAFILLFLVTVLNTAKLRTLSRYYNDSGDYTCSSYSDFSSSDMEDVHNRYGL